MKAHTFQKNPKRSWHMRAHSIILEFVPSGMCETNIYRENLIRTYKQVIRMNQESLQDPAWGRVPPVIMISITILCF
jgi:hypothetical protein